MNCRIILDWRLLLKLLDVISSILIIYFLTPHSCLSVFSFSAFLLPTTFKYLNVFAIFFSSWKLFLYCSFSSLKFPDPLPLLMIPCVFEALSPSSGLNEDANIWGSLHSCFDFQFFQNVILSAPTKRNFLILWRGRDLCVSFPFLFCSLLK